MGATMVNPDLRRKIKVRMRPDLSIKEARYGGRRFYIVKDPVALRYFRFREEELFLLQQFDGKKTLDDIRHEFVERFRPQRISVQELEKFVQQLLQAGIATADTPQIGQRLYERFQKRRRDKIKQFFLNILYIKIPVFDPEWILEAMMPWTRFLFTIPFFIMAVMFGLASLSLVVVNWEQFVTKLPSYHEFFTWRNILYFWLTVSVVKVLHEFGHGLSCKYFGGEVHEMGFLVLVLTPCLYCNVTDSWMLPNKWHRAIIGAAGIYVELIISSLFVWIWWYSEPGLLNTLSLSIIFVCSVSTVLFNANPLMRFDGYYILADLLEIPNLRERSNRYLGNQVSKLYFGQEMQPDPYTPTRYRWLFIFYAVGAYAYRIMVSIGILWFFYTFLKPYKLGTISYMLGTLAFGSLVIFPTYRVAKIVKNQWRSLKVSKVRLASGVITTLAILAAVVLAPIPMWIDVPMIVQPRDAVTVYVQTPGILDRLNVEDGQQITSGTVLASMKNPEMDKQFAKLKLKAEQAERIIPVYTGNGDLAMARKAAKEADSARQILNVFQQEVDKLQVKSPVGVDGFVISPLKPEDLGKKLKPGEPVCMVGDPNNLEAYMVVEHSDLTLIQANSSKNDPDTKQKVKIKLAGHVGQILESTIERISSTQIDRLPEALSNKHGGEVATTPDPVLKTEVPLAKSYALLTSLPNEDGTLRPGMRGWARVDIGERSIYWRVKRYLQQTIHFRL